MPYTPIVATLGYVLSPDRASVLMIHRNARPGDQHYGKYNGLGGKIEMGEDVAAGMARELREEAGIEAVSLRLRGTVNWPGFGPRGEHWLGFIFVIDAWTGQPPERNEEGELVWVPVRRVLDACHAVETRRGASLREPGASPREPGASLREPGASLREPGASPREPGASLREPGASLREPDASLPMWPGDRYFLPLVFGSEPRQFHGVMPYENGQPVDWRYTWA
jgi:8-oxo-dGTP diphosphatase